MRKLKKGFTLVELLVVIAILAVLATVSVVGYFSFTEKAKVSNDTSLASQMNTVLQGVEADGTEIDDMEEVLYYLEDAGFVLENLNPTAEGNIFVWDSSSNRIIYVGSDGNIIYSEDSSLSTVSDLNTPTCWVTVKSKSNIDSFPTLSYYFAADITDTIELTNNNVDTGSYTATSITYKSTNDSVDVTVEGNIETLVVNNANGSYKNYSNISNLTIENVASSSWHEFGYVKTLTVASTATSANIVIENSGMVDTLDVEVSSSNAKITNNGYIASVTSNLSSSSATSFTNNGYIKESSATNVTISGSAAGSTDSYVYEIASYDDLASFRDKVNGGNHFDGITVKLTANIDISGYDWVPIGYDSRDNYNNSNYIYFAGTFDGNNKTISGLNNNGFKPTTLRVDTYGTGSAKASENNYLYGLFGIVRNGKIKDLNVTNVNITIPDDLVLDSVGAIVGFVDGSITMTNCYASGTIEGNDAVGGLIGRAYNQIDTKCTVTVSNCTSIIDVTCKGYKAAGIIGFADSIKNNNNTNIEDNTITISNCINNGKVTANNYAAGIMTVKIEQTSICEISSCTNNGNICVGSDAKGSVGYIIAVAQWQTIGKTITCNWEISSCTNNGKFDYIDTDSNDVKYAESGAEITK